MALDYVAACFIVTILVILLVFSCCYHRAQRVRFTKERNLWEARANLYYQLIMGHSAHPANSLIGVRAANLKRSLHWHPTGPASWKLSQWGNAAAGEMGETCNVIKKIERVQEGLAWSNAEPIEQLKLKLQHEVGDVILYLDLLTASVNIQLSDCIQSTFNRVSERESLPERL